MELCVQFKLQETSEKVNREVSAEIMTRLLKIIMYVSLLTVFHMMHNVSIYALYAFMCDKVSYIIE